MKKPNIKVGDVFGELTVFSRDYANKNQKPFYTCICSCGRTVHNVSSDQLRNGRKTDCGCRKTSRVCKYAPKCEECPLPDCRISAVRASTVNMIDWDFNKRRRMTAAQRRLERRADNGC